MKRLLAWTIVAVTTLSAAAMAATPESGSAAPSSASVTADSVTIHTADKDVTVGLTSYTRYLKVVTSSLNNVDNNSYIGTATKEVGGKMIALEVAVFPSAMTERARATWLGSHQRHDPVRQQQDEQQHHDEWHDLGRTVRWCDGQQQHDQRHRLVRRWQERTWRSPSDTRAARRASWCRRRHQS